MRQSIERKKREVEEITKICKTKKSLIISYIESIPANKMKEIRKKLRKHAIIRILRKSLIERILKNLGIDINKVGEINRPSAILISDIDLFDIASLLEENKSFTYLKPNQRINKDIVIMKGSTDLPAIEVAELSKAGLVVGVEKGKVVIKENKVIKKGEIISKELANALQKLDIKPIKIGLNVNIGIDLVNKKIYKNIVIDREKEKEKLNKAISYAYNLAVSIEYITKETIDKLIQKAVIYANQLNKFIENKK